VAVDVPPEAEAAIEAAVAPIREAFPAARWAPRQNRHVTLKFLGAIAEGLVPWVREAVVGVAASHGPVRSALTGLGSFPSTTRTRVLWVGLADAAGDLAALAAALDDALAAQVLPEGRAFTAHLTVARADPPLRLDPSVLATRVEAPAFAIDRLVLYRSRLGRPAPRYEALATFPLAGSG
jgi:2'-5' RNA ligase